MFRGIAATVAEVLLQKYQTILEWNSRKKNPNY